MRRQIHFNLSALLKKKKPADFNVLTYFVHSTNDVVFSLRQIHPEEEDYGFEIEEKNKAIVVKSVTRGSHAEVTLITHTVPAR